MTPRELLRTVLPPLLLAGMMTSVAYAATGATTGLFFAGVVIATLLTPPLVLAETSRLKQLLVAASIVDGIAVVGLLALANSTITFGDWFRAYVVLASYSFALWGVAALFSRLASAGSLRLPSTRSARSGPELAEGSSASKTVEARFRTTIAQALTTALALTWLTWTIWLSPWIAGRERLVGLLAAPHPLLTLDGIFRSSGPPWSERYYMYNVLSVLNQDVAYELPRSILPAVLLHGTIGAAALLLARRRAVGLEVDVPDRRRSGAGEQRVSEDLLP